jgi:hypothetical protein
MSSDGQYYLPYQPSLASATSTRVDSACKHHHQCRVSTEDIQRLMEKGEHPEKIIREKYKYCVHKDEMVVSVGRPWKKDLAIRKSNNAYPRVVSNLGDMDGSNPTSLLYQQMIMYMYHFCRSLRDKEEIIKMFQQKRARVPIQVMNEAVAINCNFFPMTDVTLRAFTDNPQVTHNAPFMFEIKSETDTMLPLMHDFLAMGYAQTLGWAHANSGDTMTTVMIGGCRTVMNGDFEIMTGDIIQWYWPFERNCFHPNGWRKEIHPAFNGTMNLDPTKEYLYGSAVVAAPPIIAPIGAESWEMEKDAQGREAFHTQIFGQTKAHPKVVAKIKPYFEDPVDLRIYDRMRVFAVAISSARPHEMVDIKICRQSL